MYVYDQPLTIRRTDMAIIKTNTIPPIQNMAFLLGASSCFAGRVGGMRFVVISDHLSLAFLIEYNLLYTFSNAVTSAESA